MNKHFEAINQKIKAKNIIVFLIPIFLILVAFFDILAANNVFVGEYHDILVYQLPHLIFSDGGFPLWNNLWITGFPEFASPQSDIYYPLTLPLIYLIEDIFIQVNFAVLLHLLIAFITSYLLLGLFTKNKSVLIIFSLSYIFSALMLSRVYAGHELIVFALAWTPLLYYSFAKIIYKSEYTVKNIIIFALTSAIIFFTGALYFIVYPYFFMAIYSLYFIISRKTEKKAIFVLAVSTIIFLLITSVKSIPILSISDKLTRLDAVDPFGGGGSLESNLASFIFGTPINKGYSYTGLQYGIHESVVLIGIISLILITVALIYGKRNIAVPSFLAIVFALIWADGGKSIFSFIHILPLISSFRCPGRIFGSLLPILILLSVYGLIIVCQKIKENKSFNVDKTQKKSLFCGILILIALKLTELPFQEAVSLESFVAILLFFSFIALVYFGRLTKENLIYFFSVALLVNFAFIFINFTFNALIIGKIIIIAGVILFLICYEIKRKNPDGMSKILFVLVGVNIIICCMAGLTFIKPFDPKFDSSHAVDVLLEINNLPSENVQKWVATTGWAYKDIDYTYYFMNNGIHSVQGYNGYYLNTMLPVIYNLNNKQYFTSDYIVDTAFTETGQLTIQNYTVMAGEIPITIPDNVLPNAFIVRNDELISVNIEKFTPDEVIISGDFKKGDIVMLKSAFYEGWKINDEEAMAYGNMVGLELKSDNDLITFRFEPMTFTIGAILSLFGIISMFLLILRRKKFEDIISNKIRFR